MCGSTYNVQCGHLLSRISYGTRWEEKNAWAQCSLCNFKHEHLPYAFIRFAEDKIGREGIDALQVMWNKPKHLTNAELEEMAQSWEQKVKEMTNENRV